MSGAEVDLPKTARALIERFEKKEGVVGVVGLGYVGLPLAMVLAEAGYQVLGLDTSDEKVRALQRGESYIPDVKSARLQKMVAEGRFRPRTEVAQLASADAISICVPTPLRKTGDPDLSYIVAAAENLRAILHPGLLVILESTTYPGTTRELVQPALEADGLKVGEDLFVAFSPERVDPGREDWTTSNTPKIVGGLTPAGTRVAAALYGQAMETVVPVSSAEVAEMAKLLENTFRAVNIGLVNELALICDRLALDVWEVIEAAATKPFGFMKFTPGPGLGGHCIPIDPLYLSWKLKSVNYTARFIELASEINTNMPRVVVRRVQDALNAAGKPLNGSRVLIVGVAYKRNVSDTRESPALDVIGLLREMQAEVVYHDPYVPELRHDNWRLASQPDLAAEAEKADCVVIITDHDALDYAALLEAAPLLFDARNALAQRGLASEKVVKL